MKFCAAILLSASLVITAASAQEAIYVVRHAEQVQGVDDPLLTEAGEQRARALARFLRNAGITAVYSTQANRTRQTAEPVAAAVGVAVQQVPRENTSALIEKVRREQPHGRVLIVGHSETVPHILRGLGHARDVEIARSDYDNLFIIVPRPNAEPTVLRQQLSTVPAVSVFDTTLAEAGQKTEEISTRELRDVIRAGSAVILDARPPMEYAISHMPGALNVSPKAGLPAHQYVSDVEEVGRLLGGAKNRPLVLYCNGPFCGKVKRLGSELVDAGYTNVRRYQLGAPGWRALGGGAMQTELQALPYISTDKTAVWIDARDPAAFVTGSLSGARNIPALGLQPGKDQGVMKEAKDDGRLPMDDHNTRIIVFGADETDARAVADAIASEAFHNVSYVAAPVEEVRRAVR